MLKEIIGDIFTDGYDIICHQVNCQGAMGAGIAKSIKMKYPYAYNKYIRACQSTKNNLKATWTMLGHINFCVPDSSDKPIIVNMFAQDKYGRGKYTDYQAFQQCLSVLMCLVTDNPETPDSFKIAFPYKIGCGLGGGDWNIIHKILENFASSVKQDVYIVRLPDS